MPPKPALPLSTTAINHGFFWLMVANSIGLLMALLLWHPDLGALVGETTYGHWVPVHLNLQLYGWTSLPLIAWLLHHYRVDQCKIALATSTVILLWSSSLAFGALHWLTGHTSGKIFLDWKGPALGLFIASLLALWLLLAIAWWQDDSRPRNRLSALGLIALLAVPIAMLAATNPDLFPPVNKDTGGPTGSSLLGSTLGIILLFLILPPAIAQKKTNSPLLRFCWLLFAIESVAFILLEQQQSTHHDPLQIIALGSLLPWCYLLPKLWNQYLWNQPDPRWRHACFFWFFLLVLTGWISFLPGVLDHLKFTDGLVAHAHLAMAGFLSAFLIHLSAEITPSHYSKPLSSKTAFYIWNLSTLGYVILMWLSGYFTGADFCWLIHQGSGKFTLYGLRCLCGASMFGVSLFWWYHLTHSQSHEPT